MLIFCSHEIFFDGFLPLTKYPTRTKRLSGYTKQLNEYQTLHSDNIPSSKVESIQILNSSSLFTGGSAHPSHSKISAPPFLVPAVLDALFQNERYFKITTVVPGEADLYCSQYLQKHGGTVVSGDSDLLVHDLGPKGAVAFLKDLDFTDTSSTHFVQYQPGLIAQRLELDSAYGLRALAFELVTDSHKTFRQLLQRAVKSTSIKEYKYMYDTFIAEYQPLSTLRLQIREKDDMANALSMLDPRISEYIRQFKIFDAVLVTETSVTDVPSSSREDLDVFLPFLIDCPIRTSAWESSTHIRQLAYGLVNLVAPEHEQVSTVVEHRRQQTGSRGRVWQVPKREEISKASQSLVAVLQNLRIALRQTSGSNFWRAAALYQDVAWAESNGKTSLSDKVILPDGKRTHSKFTWDSVHFCGQMHGTYYSFRILKQILGVIGAYAKHDTLPSSVIELKAALEDLPALNELPNIREEVDTLSKGQDLAQISIIKKLLDIEEPESPGSPIKTKMASKKKRKRTKSGSNAETVAKKSTNPFDLLGDM